jgi:hypothetical protein
MREAEIVGDDRECHQLVLGRQCPIVDDDAALGWIGVEFDVDGPALYHCSLVWHAVGALAHRHQAVAVSG